MRNASSGLEICQSVASCVDLLLGHWLLAAAMILLFVAGLAFGEIDRFGHSLDAFLSMFNAGWLFDRDYSFTDVVNSLQRNSPQQGPAYYLLLNVWGRLAGQSLASGRILSIFLSLLTFCATYRLARDHIAPVAGFVAIVLLASNAFFAHYISYVRMYSLLMLLVALALWLYLRMAAGGGGGGV